jgi:Galactose oxidase, central domain
MKQIITIFLLIVVGNTSSVFAQWTQKANFGGGLRRDAVGFTIGTKGYTGTGRDGANTNYKDFWEYDPSTNAWTQKADFGGTARSGAVGFAIGTKGYIGTGSNTNDFWEYDPSTNVWTQKANCSTVLRQAGVGFAIGSKGYLGTGSRSSGNLQDFWEYDPSTNVWTQKANFGGSSRYSAVGFSIGTKGYIGTGYDNTTRFKDFWEYDPSTNAWTQKTDFGGAGRSYAVGVNVGTKAYIGLGYSNPTRYKDFWEYDPSTNAWTQKTDFPNVRERATGFVIAAKIYVGTGTDNSMYQDLWVYDPSVLPVELVDFNGQKTENGTQLSWQTASETRFAHFNVERSLDGTRFEKIGELKAKGSNSNYTFIDPNPFNVTYYRLKINDLDSKFEFSKIMSIEMQSSGGVRVKPTFVNEVLTVEGAVSYEIVDGTGHVLLQSLENQLNVQSLPQGFYVVRGRDVGGHPFVQKIIKK